MMTRTLRFSLILLALMGVSPTGYAADTGAAAMAALEAQEKALLTGVSPDGEDQFQKIRTAHGTLQMVNDTRLSLDRAVKNCAKHHKDQGFAFENAFQSWKNSVLPVVRQGQNKLDKMVLTQNFAKPMDIRAYLTAYTAAVTAQKGNITEIPVSDLSACQAMTAMMIDTQKTLAGMIKETIGIE